MDFKKISKSVNVIKEFEVPKFYDSGSYAFNAIISGSIYGGYAGNKITAIAGDPSTGKSFFCLDATKLFLEASPNNIVVYFDSEEALNETNIETRDLKKYIDEGRLVLARARSVEDFRDQAYELARTYRDEYMHHDVKMLMILDSLGQLPSTRELDNAEKKSEAKDMSRAGGIKGAFRVLGQMTGELDVCFLLTNHVYDQLDKYKPKKMSGGSGPEYNSSTIIFLSKSKDEIVKKINNKAVKTLNGFLITAKMMKSRFTKERISAKMRLSFEDGLDRYYGLIDFALEAGVFIQHAKHIEVPTGAKVFRSQIENNPEEYFTKDVLDRIDTYCKNNFTFGKNSSDKEDFEILEDNTLEEENVE